MLRLSALALTTLLLALPAAADDANWPAWRGPNHDGSSAAKDLPDTFSTTENVRWVVDMPGEAASTPIIWNDRIVLTSVDDATRNLVTLCLDRATGKELWRHDAGPGTRAGQNNNMASPSPVTDGKHIYSFFGTGVLVALDFDGKVRWQRNLQADDRFRIQFGYSASPLLHDSKLYVPVIHRAKSYLLCINTADGKELWRVERPSKAQAESLESYSTPVIARSGDKLQIVLTGGDCFTGHDPDTGKELWRWDHYNPRRIGHWRLVVSATPGPEGSNLIYAAGPKGAPLFAIPTDRTGELPEDAAKWQFNANPPDVPTATLYKNRLYVLDDRKKVLTCLKPDTGDVVWKADLDCRGVFRASPVAADGKIYLINVDGEAYVIAAQDEYKLLHRTDMSDGQRCWSSIAVADKTLLIRTESKLYNLGSD